MRKLFAQLVAISLLASCATSEYRNLDYRRIEVESEFNEIVVDKTLWAFANRARLIMQSNGRVSGSHPDAAVSGTWEWKDDKFCRTLTVGQSFFPYECQEVWVAGDIIKLTTRRFPGKYFYRIE